MTLPTSQPLNHIRATSNRPQTEQAESNNKATRERPRSIDMKSKSQTRESHRNLRSTTAQRPQGKLRTTQWQQAGSELEQYVRQGKTQNHTLCHRTNQETWNRLSKTFPSQRIKRFLRLLIGSGTFPGSEIQSSVFLQMIKIRN